MQGPLTYSESATVLQVGDQHEYSSHVVYEYVNIDMVVFMASLRVGLCKTSALPAKVVRAALELASPKMLTNSEPASVLAVGD